MKWAIYVDLTYRLYIVLFIGACLQVVEVYMWKQSREGFKKMEFEDISVNRRGGGRGEGPLYAT